MVHTLAVCVCGGVDVRDYLVEEGVKRRDGKKKQDWDPRRSVNTANKACFIFIAKYFIFHVDKHNQKCETHWNR